MASSTSAEAVLDPFQKLITKIGLELCTIDVKVIKSLVVDKIPLHILNNIDHKEQHAALDLFYQLQQYRFLSQNNLSLLKEALTTARRPDLAKKLEEFEKTVTELKDAPPSQMSNLPAPHTVFLRLLLEKTERSEELTQQTNNLRESICKILDLELKDVAFIGKEETTIQDCIFVVFQFPNSEPKITQLNFDALNKATWLVNLGVLQLQTGDKASINIKENLQDLRPIPMTQTSVLAINSRFAEHREGALDLILGIEFPSFVSQDVIKQLLRQCQTTVDFMRNDGLDVNVGVVKYGNHYDSESQKNEATACIPHPLSKDFDVIKNEGACLGGDGCSGIADALKKVEEVTTRNEASKVCIILTFLNQKSYDPSHYRCSHDNDVIKLCCTLAKNGIPLYIIGINAMELLFDGENHFLPGIATLGGGLYLEINNLNTLNKMITCIITHDMSIEKQGKVISEILIGEINRKFGIVNVSHLARHLRQSLNETAIGINGLRQNGEILAPVSQISQRVAVSDDIEEAISAINSMSLRLKASSQENLRSASVQSPQSLEKSGKVFAGNSSSKKEKSSPPNTGPAVEKELEQDEKGLVCLVEQERVDLDVAARMVRRQIYRLEYQKLNKRVKLNPE